MTGAMAVADAGLRDRFLAGMSWAACTVNVVTTAGPAGRFGVTVSAMSSVSAGTPRPTLLVCVHHLSPAAQAIIDNGVFCVNVLRDDQSYISDCFAGRFKTADGDKFSCTEWTTLATGGSPRVVDPPVAFDCRLISHLTVGTRHVLFGEAEDMFVSGPGSPLIYANRAYETPAQHPSRANRTAAPEALRIGALHTFGPYLIPSLPALLPERGHDPLLQMLEGDQRRVIEGLRASEIDVALLHDFDLGTGLQVERLSDLQPYVLLAGGSPLAARPVLSLQELAPEPLVLLDAPPSGDYFLSIFRDAGLEPTVRIRTLSFEMVRGLVGRGLGYSLITTKPVSRDVMRRAFPDHPAACLAGSTELPCACHARARHADASGRDTGLDLFARQKAARDACAFPDLE